MIIPSKLPTYWSAAHSPVNFEFRFEERNIVSINNTGTGNIVVIADASFTEFARVGGFIYIDSGPYQGYHKVVGGLLNIAFIVEGAYTTTQTTGKVSVVTSHSFRLYKGFQSGELYNIDTALPYELVAEFTPEQNLEGKLSFDISGYLQSFFSADKYPYLFTLNIGTKQYLTGIFNRYRLVEIVNNPLSAGVTLNFTGMVLQSGARAGELNALYFNQADLAEEIPPLIYENCQTDLSAINTFGAYIKRYDSGSLSTDNIVFSNAFGEQFKH